MSSTYAKVVGDEVPANWKRTTGGERALRAAPAPKVAALLPESMKAEAVIRSSLHLHHQLDLALHDLLDLSLEIPFEQYIPSKDYWNMSSTKPGEGRVALQGRLREHSPTVEAYTRLIEEVVGPHMRDAVLAEEDACNYLDQDGHHFSIRYQFPPTLRIHGANDLRFRRLHRDAEYGHQPGETNYWMPFTDASKGRSSLWVESRPEEGDLHQLELRCGEIARFYGVHCHHKAPPNDTAFCRVSLDFRIAPSACYDTGWGLFKEGKKKMNHGHREFTMPLERRADQVPHNEASEPRGEGGGIADT